MHKRTHTCAWLPHRSLHEFGLTKVRPADMIEGVQFHVNKPRESNDSSGLYWAWTDPYICLLCGIPSIDRISPSRHNYNNQMKQSMSSFVWPATKTFWFLVIINTKIVKTDFLLLLYFMIFEVFLVYGVVAKIYSEINVKTYIEYIVHGFKIWLCCKKFI